MKKQRIVLGKGFLRDIKIRTREWNEVPIPIAKWRKLYCYCRTACSCRPWKFILER